MLFTAPIYLIGLVAVGIPITIHLLQLRRYRKVYFSNVDALQKLQEQNRRQHRVQQWMVLAMRILAIVFIVLAFCRPVIPGRQYQMQAGGTAVSVYVDNSYSMECGGMDGSLIESARQKAREIAAAYRPDDRFQLLTGDAQGGQFRWLSRDEFLSEVDRIEASAASPRLSSIARRQHDFLMTAQAANRHAYMVSDFQRTTADVALLPADSVVQTTLVPLGGSGVDNLYLDTLEFNSPAYSRGATVTAEATVRNNGLHAVESVPLRLFVNGRQRALAAVDLPAGGSATVPLKFTIDEDGTLQGYVETVDYPVTFDDRLYFTLNVSAQVPVLVIGGGAENEYLHKLFADDSLTRYRFMPATNIDYTRLSEHTFIVLDCLHDIPSGMAQTLTQFVQEGGTLAIVPDSRANAEGYNRLLTAMHAPTLGPWRDSRTVVQDINTHCALYYGVFDGETTDNIEMPTTMGSFLLQNDGATVREVVMALADASPLLTLTQWGEGRLYLFSTPLTPQYTDLVSQALFVPTMYNMALYSTPRQQPYHLTTTASPIALQHRYDGEEVVHLHSTDSAVDLIPELRRIGSHTMLIPHGDIRLAGNYTLGDEGLSLNYSRDESDLSAYNASDLRGLIRDNHLGNYSLVQHADKSITDHIRERSQGTPLWRYCIILALAALAAETFFLRRKRDNH